MKILILQAYYTPEIAASIYLTENIYESFAKSGFYVDLYVPFPTRGVSKRVREQYKNKKLEVLFDGKISIHRFSMIPEYKSSIFRTLRYVFCCLKYIYYGIKCKNVDIILISSTPPIQGAMAVLLKMMIHKPVFYNLQDIFPDSFVGTSLTTKGSLLWKIGRKIENFTYHNVDRIIVISNDFKRNIIAKGVPENKIDVVYNWVDEKAVVNIAREDNILYDKYNLSRDDFYISYCGNIGLTQNMDMLLRVADDLKEIKDIHFVLIGNGVYRQDVEKIISEKHISNVSLIPFQSYENISYVFSLGDIGLVISKSGVGNNSVPSKTWSIMSAERPVLANFDENELKDIINQNNCGVFTKAGDVNSFKNAILYLYDNKNKRIEMGKNGRNFILNNLTKDIGTSKYVEIVKSFQN